MLSLILLLAACEAPPPEAPFDPVADRARREAFRDALKVSMGDAYDAPVPGVAGADLARGADIYIKSCSGCHGAYGQGDGPRRGKVGPPWPANIVAEGPAGFFSPAAQMQIIHGGSPGTSMPPMARSLSASQLLDAYAHIVQMREGVRPGR